MKFPKRVKHRGKELATIYGKSKGYPQYRVAWSVAGKRRMKAFDRYGGDNGALAFAEGLAKELAMGSHVTALSNAQARDALAALERLEAYRQASGKHISLLGCASEYAEASGKLNGRTLGEAVDGYLGTVATVRRKDLKEGVEEFLRVQAPLTRSTNGERSQISGKYHYNREIQLNRFAGTFPGHAVCDLSKEHLDTFVASLGEFSAKSRNHYRAAIRQFLEWATRKDYLARTHRLLEADSMRPERANTAEVTFYTPKEFRVLLEAAEGSMQAMIAIGGLAGLRTVELLRLNWADVWRVPSHIEVTAGKAKTRQRRLVEMNPALATWLEPFRDSTGKLWTFQETCFHEGFPALCDQVKLKRKANGLRHAFCTFHYSLHGNENLTAAQAGNSPAMIHAHYKGLATKAEAEKWFAVRPSCSAQNIIPMPDEAQPASK